MLRLPSNQNQYDDYWSGDPAFTQPDPDDPESVADHAAKVKRARETGDWSPLIKPGQQPTKFIMRQLRSTQTNRIGDQYRRADEKKIGDLTLMELIFRCALVKVVDSGIKAIDEFKHVTHPELGQIVPDKVINALGEISDSIVQELAGAAIDRKQNLNPL